MVHLPNARSEFSPAQLDYLIVVFTVFATLVPLAFLPVFFAMSCLILWHIDIVVPTVSHKIDRSVAGIIFVAMFAPFLFMTGRHMQIDGLINDTGRRGSDHDWLGVNKLQLKRVDHLIILNKADIFVLVVNL